MKFCRNFLTLLCVRTLQNFICRDSPLLVALLMSVLVSSPLSSHLFFAVLSALICLFAAGPTSLF